jgi:hypothetical protein
MSVDDVGGFPLRLQELGGETGQFQFLEITGVSTPYKIPDLSERAVMNAYEFLRAPLRRRRKPRQEVPKLLD